MVWNNPTRSARHTAITLTPLLVWAAVILTVSSFPGDQLPQAPSLWRFDKVAHFAEYFVLAVLIARHLTIKHSLSPLTVFILSAAASTVFGIADELHQMLIPLRTCTWQDMLANTGGSCAGAAIWQYLCARQRNK